MAHRRPHAKTAYHHGNLREDLVTVALDIVHKTGAEGLTLRAVAERLGVSQAAPYRHFPTKGALLAAVAVDGFLALQREMERRTKRAGSDVMARFRAAAVAYTTFAMTHPAHFKVMYGPRPEEFRSGPVAEAGRAAFLSFRTTIEACLAGVPAKPREATRIAISAWAYVHGLVTLYGGGQLVNMTPARLRHMARGMDLFLTMPE